MEILFLIKYGEIALKGKNKSFFLRKLKANILRKMKGIPSEVTVKWDRLYLTVPEDRAGDVERILPEVFGVVSFSRAVRTDKNPESVRSSALATARRLLPGGKTFKIEARRTDKSFPMSSYEIACDLGDFLREKISGLTVNLSDPDWTLNVEIRESAYIYGPESRGPGGLPAGSSGRGILLLSGGIDSPVAGYLMAKRGLRLDSVYFHTFPYTSDKAREKTEKLAGILSHYLPGSSLFVVPYTEVQLIIKERSAPEALTLLSRACMMAISSVIAKRKKAGCLITGESLGQVASQTLRGLSFTESRSGLPVFRPLIGMDKEEIIALAKRIGTYETSILPYPDCCTVFAHPHPLTRPDIHTLIESYNNLHLEQAVIHAAKNVDTVHFYI